MYSHHIKKDLFVENTTKNCLFAGQGTQEKVNIPNLPSYTSAILKEQKFKN